MAAPCESSQWPHAPRKEKSRTRGQLASLLSVWRGRPWTRTRLPIAFKLFYRTVLREHMADKGKQAQVVRSSGLDWTLVQSVGLIDGPCTDIWLANTDGLIRGPQLSRKDGAAFVVSLAAATDYFHVDVALSG